MNAKFELEIADQNIVVSAFRTPGGTAELFERIAQEARSHVPDVTTKKGRDQIGSLALKISKSKTFIEKCGKELVAEQKAQIKLIDDDRIATVKKFDELRNEILAPRDAWEQAEKDRVAKHKEAVQFIKDHAPEADATSLKLKGDIEFLENLEIGSQYEEFEEQAKLAKFETLEALRKALADREKLEAEQAELERLRQAEIDRQQKEREEAIAREATEKAQREAEAKARFEAERVEREKLEAEQRESQLKIEKEQAELREQQLKQQAIEREKQAEIDRQKAVEAERLRIEREAEAKAEAERKAEEARKANIEHMRSINCEAVKALCFEIPSLTEEMAKDVIRAIAKNSVPNVSIKY
ncbi:hypothetical protein BEN71_10425 [Acinetobacter wuhouensis]|uniref:hypothetical protein n=1 Tax=Acinetobacter wuhouensis TaxID=1879050 RepID=UPI00083B8D91|nr:hypothetical protein [Acinetobacter wuhouensis]AXQ21802.1 hypothetical protein BEN71_06865 [Acinetobacter wuhouensis]AXQ22462.1 hypothetical protein BEN71_10425 [Acinetobacter wuhouensis]